ncbi:MAG: hypothetical protein Q4B01_01510 [Eubacteriales bacterium]|nr:hypothetical protein [Eubacteriales bacterium]
MEHRRKNCFKGTLAGVCMLALAAGSAESTQAYFTWQDSVVNVLTVGGLQLDLKEPEWDPEDGDGKGMIPGDTVYKNPTVRNQTEESLGGICYLRMQMRILDASGEQITDEDRLALIRNTIYYDNTYTGTFTQKGVGEKLVEGRTPGYSLAELAVIDHINPLFAENTEESAPGKVVYDYLGTAGDGRMSPGEEAVLFTSIVVPTDWEAAELELLGDFTLEISASGVQAVGFASGKEAFAAAAEKTAAQNGNPQTAQAGKQEQEDAQE